VQAAEAAEAKLKTEEAVKADLCRDLSELVAQSADAQLVRGGALPLGPAAGLVLSKLARSPLPVCLLGHNPHALAC